MNRSRAVVAKFKVQWNIAALFRSPSLQQWVDKTPIRQSFCFQRRAAIRVAHCAGGRKKMSNEDKMYLINW